LIGVAVLVVSQLARESAYDDRRSYPEHTEDTTWKTLHRMAMIFGGLIVRERRQSEKVGEV